MFFFQAILSEQISDMEGITEVNVGVKSIYLGTWFYEGRERKLSNTKYHTLASSINIRHTLSIPVYKDTHLLTFYQYHSYH